MTRIIAGSRRGRRLAVPRGDATRPTSDRVREALFSAVAVWAGTAAERVDQSLRGLAVADLFAGSGAVGLEAASRGADPVLLVESAFRTADVIGRNVAELGLGGAVSVRQERVEPLVRTTPPRTYDVVFLDPPYALAAGALTEILTGVVDNGWIDPDGLIVVERSRRDAALDWPPGFGEGWRRDYGETTLIFAFRPDLADADDHAQEVSN